MSDNLIHFRPARPRSVGRRFFTRSAIPLNDEQGHQVMVAKPNATGVVVEEYSIASPTPSRPPRARAMVRFDGDPDHTWDVDRGQIFVEEPKS